MGSWRISLFGLGCILRKLTSGLAGDLKFGQAAIQLHDLLVIFNMAEVIDDLSAYLYLFEDCSSSYRWLES